MVEFVPGIGLNVTLSNPLSHSYEIVPVADTAVVSVNTAGASPEQIVKVVLLIVPAVLMIFSVRESDATVEQLAKEYGFEVTSTRTISLSFNNTGGTSVLGLNIFVVLF